MTERPGDLVAYWIGGSAYEHMKVRVANGAS